MGIQPHGLLIADINSEKMENNWSIDIPYALSYLAYSEFSGSVDGMKTLQATYEKLYGEGVNYIPHVESVFWSFRIMAGFGGLMALLSALGLFFSYRKTIEQKTWLLIALFISIVSPFIANTAGWIMTEIGRQPWTVFGLYTTAQSVSPNVSAGQILFSTISFSAAYLILGIIMVSMVIKVVKKGPYQTVKKEENIDLLDKEAFES